MSDVRREIEALADLFEGGHLLATTDPAEFLRIVRAEIERLRKLADAVCGARNATDNEQFCRAMDVVVERLRELEDS